MAPACTDASLGTYPSIHAPNHANNPPPLEKRLPAIADRAVWEKTTEGAGKRWDNVVEKLRKGLGDREEVLSIEKFGGYKTEVE